MRVLIVEDDADISRLLRDLLTENSLVVDTCALLADAKALLSTCEYDAVVLDLGLPDGDGRSILRHVREHMPVEKRPVILILTARDAVEDIVDGFEGGALDYMVKPYEPLELVTRLKVCLRFKQRPADRMIECGNIRFDTNDRQLYVGKKRIHLKRRELAILEKLVRRQGHTVPHEQLVDAAYALEDDIESNALASHTSRLRRQLRDAGANVAIKAVRHIGYYIEQTEC